MAITSTEKKRRFILFSLLGLAAAVVIVLASFLLFTPEKPSGTSKMAAARTEAVSGQAGGVGSEEYNTTRNRPTRRFKAVRVSFPRR